MTYPEPSVEVTIVDAETVRRYARETLSSDEKSLVEDMLLDDDRARALVEAEAVDETDDHPLTGRARKKAKKALKACSKAVACYEMLAKADGPPTVQQFAQSRFSERWALLREIREALPAKDRNIVEAVRIKAASENSAEATDTAIKEATAQDTNLINRLRDAFREKASPLWKARIAERIAQIDDDNTRISWLTTAFA